MLRLGLLLTSLVACNQWVRPKPLSESLRSADEQKMYAVKVEARCAPFGGSGVNRVGSGVMVSDWQVLTALHVVDCQPALVTIYVTSPKGRWRFAPEKEWRGSDIARIQMASGDTFGQKVRPPVLRLARLPMYEPVYVQAAQPEREEIIGESTGYSYGGVTYGGYPKGEFSYKIRTQPGNSGSGVYDRFDKLVGIHTKRSEETNIAYASFILEEMIPR